MIYAANDDLLFRIGIGDVVSDIVDWVTSAWKGLFSFIKAVLLGIYDAFLFVLQDPTFWVVGIIFGLIALAGLKFPAAVRVPAALGVAVVTAAITFFVDIPSVLIIMAALILVALLASGIALAAITAVGLVLIYGVSQWDLAMETLALVIEASLLALIAAIPLGILAAKSRVASAIIRPILDFMQTMPAFVYLIPAVVIFFTGPTVGIIATVIFAMAPGVRFTELGIRQVDSEVVEAGHAFGSSPWRILRQIELPLATPTIMAGINQVIMLSLSMVVIAGMVGAGGLGKDVVSALSRVNVSLGFEAGLAVVILAIYLDRVTSGLSSRSAVARAEKARAE